VIDRLLRRIQQAGNTYVIADYRDGSPYLTRTVFRRLFGLRPLLHFFHRPDSDRHLHNHPWRWSLSIILRGSYTEERLGREGTRRVRWFNFITDRDYHRIQELHGEVWTLFITGRRTQGWGFLVDGQFVPWREYIDARHGA
jgi:hypothetical protein